MRPLRPFDLLSVLLAGALALSPAAALAQGRPDATIRLAAMVEALAT